MPIIDLIAGMIFIYFLLATVNNSCIELYASLVQLRSSVLKKWVAKHFGEAVKGVESPYIDSKAFAQQVSSIFQSDKDHSTVPETTRNLLQSFAGKADLHKKADVPLNEAVHFEKQIEGWFDHQMDQLSAIYKRKTMWFTFGFASLITLALNVDSLQLANYLYQNPTARVQLASAIQTVTHESTSQTDAVKIGDALSMMNAGLPVGWPDSNYQSAISAHAPFWYYLRKSGGLIITILAICLGAPFWFDVLNKVANLRSGKKPSTSAI